MTIEYVSEEEYAATLAEFQERVRKKDAQDALKQGWRKNGSTLTLAQKIGILTNA